MSDKVQIHYKSANATEILSKEIEANIRTALESGKTDIVFVCIGTDRSTGDSLGPQIGSRIFGYENNGFFVYGTLENPVHAKNLEDTLKEISTRFQNPYVIAIDACLGKMESVGFITIGEGSIVPGAALKKQLPSVGNMFITGIVNIGGYMDFVILQNTRLSVVMDMSAKITSAVKRAVIKVIGRDTTYSPKGFNYDPDKATETIL